MGSRRRERPQDVLYDEKPKGQKRVKTRRNVVQDSYGKPMETESSITKTIYDPMKKLSEKEWDRLASGLYDGMCPVIPYSTDKHKRWELTPMILLQNTKNHDAEVMILERKTTHKFSGGWLFDRYCEIDIRAVHFCDGNNGLVKKTCERMGTSLKNLLVDHQTHKKSKDCACCRSWNEDPRVEYSMIGHHENQWIRTGQITGGGHDRWIWPPIIRCHTKRQYLEQLWEMSSDEEDWDDDYDDSSDEGSTGLLDKKFCLGDFVVDKPINMKEWVMV